MTTQSPDATEQEPTEAMIEAGARAYYLAIGGDDPDEFILEETPQWVAYIDEARTIYRAMRAALPSNATTNASLVEALEGLLGIIGPGQRLKYPDEVINASNALATLRASNPDEEG